MENKKENENKQAETKEKPIRKATFPMVLLLKTLSNSVENHIGKDGISFDECKTKIEKYMIKHKDLQAKLLTVFEKLKSMSAKPQNDKDIRFMSVKLSNYSDVYAVKSLIKTGQLSEVIIDKRSIMLNHTDKSLHKALKQMLSEIGVENFLCQFE